MKPSPSETFNFEGLKGDAFDPAIPQTWPVKLIVHVIVHVHLQVKISPKHSEPQHIDTRGSLVGYEAKACQIIPFLELTHKLQLNRLPMGFIIVGKNVFRQLNSIIHNWPAVLRLVHSQAQQGHRKRRELVLKRILRSEDRGLD